MMWRPGCDAQWFGPLPASKAQNLGSLAEWYSVPPAPTVLAPEPEGVEVGPHRYRRHPDNEQRVQYLAGSGMWQPYIPASLGEAIDVAQALGLVPAVPQSLIDWLRRSVDAGESTRGSPVTMVPAAGLLHMIEAGEFGPVEPSAPICDYCGDRLAYFCPNDQCVVNGGESAPTVEWVTDRLPNNDEYPVLFHMHATGEDEWGYLTYDGPLDDGPDDTVTAEQVAGKDGWRWVPLRSLLDAAGLGER